MRRLRAHGDLDGPLLAFADQLASRKVLRACLHSLVYRWMNRYRHALSSQFFVNLAVVRLRPGLGRRRWFGREHRSAVGRGAASFWTRIAASRTSLL